MHGGSSLHVRERTGRVGVVGGHGLIDERDSCIDGLRRQLAGKALWQSLKLLHAGTEAKAWRFDPECVGNLLHLVEPVGAGFLLQQARSQPI